MRTFRPLLQTEQRTCHGARGNLISCLGSGHDAEFKKGGPGRNPASRPEADSSSPADHPFVDVFPGWYWSSPNAAISLAHVWYVNMGGGRVFYRGKDQSFFVWPVRATGNGAPPVWSRPLRPPTPVTPRSP